MGIKKGLGGSLALALLFTAATMTGCSSGGSSTPAATTTTTTNDDGETLSSLTTGYAVPSDISAVPEDTSESASFLSRISALASAVADLPADSDYAQAKGAKYIEEPVLDQFEIVEEVLDAISQTKYADSGNVNQGPYKAMIAWTDERDGKEIKTLEPWIVDSRMIVEDDQDVNRVLAWIEENTPEGEMLVKAEFKIYEAATIGDDGKIADYGKWDLNVSFNDSGTDFFAATSTPNPDGGSIISVSEQMDFGEGGSESLKGVLYWDKSTGYGKVSYPDWQSCSEWPCTPTTAEAKYAYNSGYLGVQKNSDATKYKDRSSKVSMTHRYGLFYDENPPTTGPSGKAVDSGDNVLEHNSFGFPVTYTDTSGYRMFAYYGAWQGRHELWGDESGVPASTTVTKESWGDADPETYTIADVIKGSFTKRTYVDADLTDIKDIPVETWIDKGYDMFYNAGISEWQYCQDGWIDWCPSDGSGGCNPPECKDFATGVTKVMSDFTAYDTLIVGENDRKWVNINNCDDSGCTDYVYLAADDNNVTWSSAGFYEAKWGQDGNMVSVTDATRYNPLDRDNMWVSIGGSIYIAYNADFAGVTTTTGWVQKELVSFDEREWKPVFGENDSPFSPQMGREYYMNSNGVNYVVKRIDQNDAPEDYQVLLEIQKTANPVNCTATDCSEIVPAQVSYFRTPWESNKRYEFITDSTDTNYMMLVYLTNDPNTEINDIGTVYTQGMWGLQAWNDNDSPNDTADDYPLDASGTEVTVDEWGMPDIAGGETDRPVEFNWEYCDPSSGGCWGAQTYLKDADNNYVILSDPIQLAQIPATNGAGNSKNLMLQYDGWMHGLPDLYRDLQDNGWEMTQAIKDKIINIPAATAVTDSEGTGYYLKPMETSIFLEEVTAAAIEAAGGTVPGITEADSIDLTTDVPTFTDHEMGAMPEVTTVKYSEGVLVE